MKDVLPKSIGSHDIPSLFALCARISSTTDRIIELDASKVEFVDPQGLAVLGALLSPMADKEIRILWMPKLIAGYLDRMDFFSHVQVHGVEIPKWGRNDRRERLVELTCIHSHAESDDAANRLADAITGQITDADPAAPYDPSTGKNQYDKFRHPLWYSLSELLENALTHARQQGNNDATVWVAAQYYEKKGLVKMAVVDNGCGFLSTLESHPELPEKTHLSAIATALIPKVSCNRDGMLYHTQGNQGVGLTTTARIAKSARGGLTIASGDSFVRTRSNRDRGVLPQNGFWKGVSIDFQCRRGDLPGVRVSQLLPQESSLVPLTFEE